MPPLNFLERDEFLAARGILMRVATVDADGDPHVTPIWFIHEDGRIWFTPRKESLWLEHVRAHARVALAIDEEAGPYRKVVVEGDAEIVHDLGDDDVWRDRYRRIALRYVPPEGAETYIQNTLDQPRTLLAVTLDESTVKTWRMPQGGESASGIWHRRYYVAGSKFADEANAG